MARAVTRLEEVHLRNTELTLEHVKAIFSEICDRDTLTLKVLDISYNTNVSKVEPGLLVRAVTRLEEVNVTGTQVTIEQ